MKGSLINFMINNFVDCNIFLFNQAVFSFNNLSGEKDETNFRF